MTVDPTTSECACPAGAFVEDCDATYPPAGEGGRLTTVLNQNDQNECQACAFIENCQDAWDYGLITADEQYTYVRAPSTVTGRANPTVEALCLRMTTDGGLYGETEPRVLTHIMCDDLEQYGSDCIESQWSGPAGSPIPSVDTCTQYGYIRQPFRSQEHYQKLYQAFGISGEAYEWDGNYRGNQGTGWVEFSFDFITYFEGSTHGFYHDTNGGGSGYEGAMRSDPGSNQNAKGWKSVDDGPWWAHDFTGLSEPGSSYTAYENLNVDATLYWYYAYDDNWNLLTAPGYAISSNYGAPIEAASSYSTPWSGSKYVCGHEHTNPSGRRRV
jgi:hypothetical protein